MLGFSEERHSNLNKIYIGDSYRKKINKEAITTRLIEWPACRCVRVFIIPQQCIYPPIYTFKYFYAEVLGESIGNHMKITTIVS